MSVKNVACSREPPYLAYKLTMLCNGKTIAGITRVQTIKTSVPSTIEKAKLRVQIRGPVKD